ncbi:MAG TPA: thioredoxin domain-containing protein, partial [Polyangiaceae bacterium]
AAIGIPFLSHLLVKTTVPEVVAAEMAKTPPGQVTIVDFVDFECPFCRQTAADFEPTLAKYPGKYRLVRKQMPLTRIHPHSAAAARAACCGETFRKGDEMAAKLFSAPVDQLDDDGCAKIAESLGIDADAFKACMTDPNTQKKIDADAAEFKAARGHALPTIWIGGEVIEGAQGPEKLQKAMDKAISELGS